MKYDDDRIRDAENQSVPPPAAPPPPIYAEDVDFTPRSPASLNVVGAQFGSAHSPSRSSSEHILGAAIRSEYRYGQFGLVLGLACILGGVILGLNGVAGSTSWTAALLGLRSEINDAAPGVVLFIVGIFFVWITKPKVNLKDLRG